MKKALTTLYKLVSPLLIWLFVVFLMADLHPAILDRLVKALGQPDWQSGIEAALIFIEIVLFYQLAKALPEDWKDGEGLRAISLKQVGLLILVALGLFISSEVIQSLIQERLYTKMTHPFTLPELAGEEVTWKNMMQFTNGRTFLITIILDPCLEELFFRYLMNLPYRSPGWKVFGLLTSSFLFAISHGFSPSFVVGNIFVGSCFYLFFKSTKNLSMSIALHMALNLIVTVFLALSIKFPIAIAYLKDGEIVSSSFTAVPVAIQIISILLDLVAGYYCLTTYESSPSPVAHHNI